MKRSSLALVAVTLLAVVGSSPYSHGQSQNQAPRPAHSRADETLDMWNEIGNKLIAIAQDFPEDKYDFRLQKAQRSFAQNLLHVAGVDYDLMRSVSRSKFGPEFAKNPHNPSRDVYKTKADVVKLIQQAVADGADLIQQQGEAGLDKTTKFAFGNRLVHNSYIWMFVIEHSGITPCEEVSDYEKRLCSFVHRRHSSFSLLGARQTCGSNCSKPSLFRNKGTSTK